MAEDLSIHHELLGDLFSLPSTGEEWNQFELSADQLAFFEEYGYLRGIRILDDRQVEILQSELADLLQPNHDGCEFWYEYHTNESADPATVLFHALGAWRIKTGFHDLLWNPAFTVPARQLLNGGVRFWHDQLFCKPARHGGVVAWHQDYSYWTRTKPMAHLTCWIALDDSTKENGCVQYVPRSHQWDVLPITGLAGD
ncbi:MAG: phytanoyl-CoA dioxygenase family protein, partial [Planctomycetes bacterium]|nr:phytanoyl-CoA dioxygenase family protein [Planctomycetota bacterium]